MGASNIAQWVVSAEDLTGPRGSALNAAGAVEGDELVVLVVESGYGEQAAVIADAALRAANWEPA